LIKHLYNTEIEYTKCFSEFSEERDLIRFWDDFIPDMYSHNFLLLKENMSNDDIRSLIAKEGERRREENKDFLVIESTFSISDEILEEIPYEIASVEIQDYMYIAVDKYYTLNGNTECVMERIVNAKQIEDAVAMDIFENAPVMGEDFAERRIKRKIKAYEDRGKVLSGYLCYSSDAPVGHCELFVNGRFAKFEDFGVLEPQQRKGYGTAILRDLMQEAQKQGVEYGYVVTDADDTAKDMYSKCGFIKGGQKTRIRFSL
jgi:spore maturation protein CgeE